MNTNNSSPGGSENNAFGGSKNNVYGSYAPPTINGPYGLGFTASNEGSANGLPTTATPPTDSIAYSDIAAYTGPLGATLSQSIVDPLPSDNSGWSTGTPNVVWTSGSHIEDPGLKLWEYYGQYTPSPPTSLIWSAGPTFLIISAAADFPAKTRYKMFVNIGAAVGWPNSACVQCYISTHGDGTHLVPVGPAFTPPFYEDYSLSNPPDLNAEFIFNPIELLGNVPFYLVLGITGGPSNVAATNAYVAIATRHN